MHGLHMYIPSVLAQDTSGSMLDRPDHQDAVMGETPAAVADTGTPLPAQLAHWVSFDSFLLRHMHACILIKLRIKGPAEKTMFPTVSQTTNPYQVLPQFLHILGKKTDSASLVKVGVLDI